MGVSSASQSCTSCGVNWKCHFSLPLSGSSAMSEQVYRLSPLRLSPYRSAPGLPAPQYSVFSLGSNVPVIQVGPPPLTQESPSQVSPPGSPFAGIVQTRQMRAPVFASYASRNPRTPCSPPPIPTITL